jgi:hypothetical protein
MEGGTECRQMMSATDLTWVNETAEFACVATPDDLPYSVDSLVSFEYFSFTVVARWRVATTVTARRSLTHPAAPAV